MGLGERREVMVTGTRWVGDVDGIRVEWRDRIVV